MHSLQGEEELEMGFYENEGKMYEAREKRYLADAKRYWARARNGEPELFPKARNCYEQAAENHKKAQNYYKKHGGK